jgi:hypothetical protein
MNTAHRTEQAILRLLSVVVLGFAVGCGSRTGNTEIQDHDRPVVLLDSTTRVVLPSSPPPELLGRCDRAYEGSKSLDWMPPPSLVQAIDERLGPLLNSALLEVKEGTARIPPNPIEYYRQYSGVTIRAKQWVYINGFHRSLLATHGGAAPSDTVQWRSFPVVPCDAGLQRFGVMFDVRKGRFTRLEFTDSYEGRIRY